MMGRFMVFGLVVAVCLGVCGGAAAAMGGGAGSGAAACVFVENTGQWNLPEVLYVMQGAGGRVGLTDRGPVFELSPQGRGGAVPESAPFRLVLEGAAPVVPTARSADHGGTMWYENVYPGVDLEVLARPTGIKYNFHVAPGADWRVIRLRYEGIHGLSLRPDGAMEIHLNNDGTPLAARGKRLLVDAAPYIYQDVSGEKRAVSGAFHLLEESVCGFNVTGIYKMNLPLVIDPEVAWGSYLGGSSYDMARDVTIDSIENILVVGETISSGWVSGGYDITTNGSYDAFVIKFNVAGQHLWSTYVGGTQQDYGTSVAVDPSNNIYICGHTFSNGWVGGGWDWTYGGSFLPDGYVVKISSSGSYQWSSYIGSSNEDYAHGVSTDGSGSVYITGATKSSGWTSGGWDTVLGGAEDGFVVKLSTTGTHLWSTYLGGSGTDWMRGVDVFNDTWVYCVGMTNSADWISGGHDASFGGAADGCCVKLNGSGGHVWSTYMGGAGADYAFDLAVTMGGDVCITGETRSDDWVLGGWDVTRNGLRDAFILRIAASGLFSWSSYIGGHDDEYGYGITVDQYNNIYVAGKTFSGSPSWVNHGWDTTFNSYTDGFLLKCTSNGEHGWSSYIGGTDGSSDQNTDAAHGVAVSPAGNLYVVGVTESPGWVSGGWNTTFSGGTCDGFCLRVRQTPPSPPPSLPIAEVLSPTEILWRWQDNSNNELGFLIWADAGANPPVSYRATTGINSTSWIHSGLSANTPYSFQVAGTNIDGESARTPNCTAFTFAYPPVAPVIAFSTETTIGLAVGTGDLNPPNTEYALYMEGVNKWISFTGSLVDDAVWRSASGWSLTIVTGLYPYTPHAFSVKARNGAGVLTSFGPTATAMTQDWSSPTGTISINGGAAYTTGVDVSLALTYDDGMGSGVVEMQFSNDNSAWSGWEAVTATKAWVLEIGDGAKTVYVQYRDLAGNVSTVEISDTITLDANGPTGTVEIDGGAAYTTGVDVILDLAYGDGTGSGVVEMQFSNDNSAWSGWEAVTATKAWVLEVGDGGKTVYVQYRDLAANVSMVDISDTINLDETEPTGTLEIEGGAAYTTDTLVTLSVTTDDLAGSGVVDMQFSNNNAVWSGWEAVAGTKSWVLEPGDGLKTAYVQYRDAAGNVSTADISDAITLDETAPSGGMQIDGGAAYTTDSDVILSLVYDDGFGSGVGEMRFSHDGFSWEPWMPVAATALWTLSAGDGLKTVHAQFRDLAGNETPSGISADITLDSQAPTAVITLLDPTPTQAATLRYSVAFSEPVAPTFDVTDLALSGALAGDVSIEETDPDYVVTVSLTDAHPDGLSGIGIGGDVTDVAGNAFAGAVSGMYDVVYWPGFAAPLAGVTGYAGDAGPVFDATPAAGAVRVPVYQWLFDRGTSPPPENGPTTSAWDLGTLTLDEAGEYWCVVTYGGFTFETSRAAVELRDRISITDQPDDLLVRLGKPASFDVSATGGYSPLHYQWKKNGDNLPGSPDAPALSISPTNSGHSGMYAVEVSDSHTDSTLSAEARLTVETGVPATGVFGLAALAGLLAAVGSRRRFLQKRGGART